MDTTFTEIGTDRRDPLGDETWTGCESLIRAFEQAWRQGPPPAIDDYLPPESARRGRLLRELVHTDLEFRIKSGEHARVENYLERYPELASDGATVLDLIETEFELRRRRESDLTADDYCRRFPHLSGDVIARLSGRRTSLPRPAHRAQGPTPPPAVPGYEIIAEIGRGGMGVVYQAREPRLGRHVALKFLPAELAGEPLLMQRFVREAQTASALNHPHICTVHLLGEHDGRPFIVLEYIEGQTLKSLAAGRPSIAELARLVRQAAGALAAAHAAGVVHRDVKPENLMVRPDGYVKVLDFGLARRLPTLAPGSAASAQDTWPGAVLGTVAYMSPEQARGEPLDGASDVFSLGIVLYQLVTGQHPFDRGSPLETLHAIANTQPAPPSRLNPAASAALEGLIEAMLHKDPRLRPTAAEVEAALATAARPERAAPDRTERRVVRREPELAALHRGLAAAEAGRGAVVCVSGEPGIGKTTLVEGFLDELAASDAYLLARGRCSERQAAASAYLPVIDALADLLRGQQRSTVVRLMGVVAPTWSSQLSLAETTPAAPGALALSQQGMLGEFAKLLAELSRLGTVVLFVDDVHWADVSTVDLLAYIGRQCHSLRVLVIVTFRPTELLLGPHPFHRVRLELQGQGVCSELALGFLGRSEIDRYLSLVFPGHAFPGSFGDLVHSRTEGNPLFLTDLVRYLRERDVIAQSDGRWTLASQSLDLWRELPESVRSMIQRKLERLDENDHRLLSAAAVQGHQFDSSVVAAAAGRDPAEVEERLQVLDRVHGLVRLLREDEFPDRTLTLRYAFVHVLYQQALFSALTPTRRAAISRALATTWERRLGEQSSAAAAELACLYEAGRDFAAAGRQFGQAARNAVPVFAHREAVSLARRGLGLLYALPPSAERDALELPLQTTLGLQLQVTEGYAAPAAEEAYERARQLCTSSQHALFPVLWGLWLVRKVRSELPHAQELAAELLDVATRLHDPDLALQAHQALGLTALCRGAPAESLRHVEQVATLYNPDRHRPHAFLFGQDPGVICKAYGAVALWLLGFPEAAARQSEQAIEMSRGLSPTTQSVALHFAAMVFELARDIARARQCAEDSAAIAAEHGFPFWLAGGTIISGAALTSQGDLAAGVNRLKHGLAEWDSTGSVTYKTYFLGLLGAALARLGAVAEAQQVVSDALALAERTDERMIEPELYRLRGELRLEIDSSQAVWPLAEADFRTAIQIAGRQESRSLELRAATSLTRHQQKLGAGGDASQYLARLLASFTEGRETADLREASALVGS